MTLHVMLVDDHAVVRAGYRRLLELGPDCVVSADCADGDSSYALLLQRQPPPVDLIVLDLSIPGRSGFDLLRRIVLRWPVVRRLVFSMHDSPAMVAALRRVAAGAVARHRRRAGPTGGAGAAPGAVTA